MNRRTFLLSLAAPAVITTAGLLMPVRKPLWTERVSLTPREWIVDTPGGYLTVYDSLGKAYRIPVAL